MNRSLKRSVPALAGRFFYYPLPFSRNQADFHTKFGPTFGYRPRSRVRSKLWHGRVRPFFAFIPRLELIAPSVVCRLSDKRACFSISQESQIVIPPISKAPHVPEAIAKPKAKTKMSEGRAVQASVPPSGALAQRGVSDDSFAFGAPQATRISV